MTTKIRVLHLIEDLGWGGAERLLYTNLSHFDRTQFDGLICYLYHRKPHWLQPMLDLGYPVKCLGMVSLFDSWRGLPRLLQLLRREHVDLIHTHLYAANLIGRLAGALSGIPILSSLHSPDYEPAQLVDNPRMTRRKLAILRSLDRFTIWASDPHFLAVSQYVAKSAQHSLGIDSDKIHLSYNPINLTDFNPDSGDTGALRTELGLTPNTPVVLCVARFDPMKGLKYLLQAIPQLVEHFPTITVLFIGSGPPEAQAWNISLAEQLGVASNVRFLGVKRDVHRYLALCDVFVLPSLYEGMGIALVEAMAMERACVSTNSTAIPEVVADGQSGILVPPMNPSALAEAISGLLENPALRAQMGAAGRRIVAERFNVERTISDLERLYQQLASKSTRARTHSG